MIASRAVRRAAVGRPSRARTALLPLAALGLALGGAPTAAAAPPTVTAPSAAVIEASTGTVLFAKDADTRRGMASTTKLMTALVALDDTPLSTRLRAVDYAPTAAETRLGLQAGETMALGDLLRAMMLPSANDAAQTVAVRIGGTRARFVARMNAKARSMGLDHTHFTNPVGLDAPTHRTSALDLARIGVAAHDNAFLRGVVRRPRITLATGAVTRTVVNRNDVLGDRLPGGGVIDGMKTGHTTAAGYSLVGSATRGGVTVVSTVLGEPSEAARDADTVRLLRWASRLMVRRTLARERETVATVPVEHGARTDVEVVVPKAVRGVVARNARVSLRPGALPAVLEAPVPAGSRVGTAQVLVNGRAIRTVPVVSAVPVERQGPVAALREWLGDHAGGLLLAVTLLLGGTVLIARARGDGRPPRTRKRSEAPRQPPTRTTAS